MPERVFDMYSRLKKMLAAQLMKLKGLQVQRPHNLKELLEVPRKMEIPVNGKSLIFLVLLFSTALVCLAQVQVVGGWFFMGIVSTIKLITLLLIVTSLVHALLVDPIIRSGSLKAGDLGDIDRRYLYASAVIQSLVIGSVWLFFALVLTIIGEDFCSNYETRKLELHERSLVS